LIQAGTALEPRQNAGAPQVKQPKPATQAPATRTAAKPTKPATPSPALARPVARKAPKELTEGQRAYEAKRAAKAGISLEKWLAAKERDRLAEEKARLKAAEAAKPAKPPGFFKRLLERAHKPLKTRI
jgi:hypothetical protein